MIRVLAVLAHKLGLLTAASDEQAVLAPGKSQPSNLDAGSDEPPVVMDHSPILTQGVGVRNPEPQ